MARNYKRDARGRFSGGGGGSSGGGGGGKKAAGGGKAKAPSTRAANDATEKRLLDKGLRGVGGRLAKKNESLYQGTAKTKRSRSSRFTEASEQLRTDGRMGQPAVDGAWNRGASNSRAKVRGTISKKRGK
jgi:predicted NAD/FAD-dependent oxidoreductase